MGNINHMMPSSGTRRNTSTGSNRTTSHAAVWFKTLRAMSYLSRRDNPFTESPWCVNMLAYQALMQRQQHLQLLSHVAQSLTTFAETVPVHDYDIYLQNQMWSLQQQPPYIQWWQSHLQSQPVWTSSRRRQSGACKQSSKLKSRAQAQKSRRRTPNDKSDEGDDAVFKWFIQLVHSEQRRHNQSEQTPNCLLNRRRHPTRKPALLQIGDTRFEKKATRTIHCDRCGNIVTRSSRQKNTTFQRFVCEFAGSYNDNTWADIPSALHRLAWENRLIDATWSCSEFCDVRMTGLPSEKRRLRAQVYALQEEQQAYYIRG